MSLNLSLQLKYMVFHIPTCIFTIYGYITKSQRDQLPNGLIVQLVEVSQRSWVRIPFKAEFCFQALISQLLKLCV